MREYIKIDSIEYTDFFNYRELNLADINNWILIPDNNNDNCSSYDMDHYYYFAVCNNGNIFKVDFYGADDYIKQSIYDQYHNTSPAVNNAIFNYSPAKNKEEEQLDNLINKSTNLSELISNLESLGYSVTINK